MYILSASACMKNYNEWMLSLSGKASRICRSTGYRITLLVVMAGGCYSRISAQSSIKANLEIGYGGGAHIQVNGLSFIVDRYNETHAALTTSLPAPHLFYGLNIAGDVYFNKFMMDVEWVGRKSNMHAEDAATGDQRDLRYQQNTFNFGVGWKAFKNKDQIIGFYPGLDFSTISVKNYTRIYNIQNEAPDYTKINWDLVVGFSPFIQYAGSRFTAKLYYQFMILDQDFLAVNEALNPNTWFEDLYEDNFGKASTLGIGLRFNLWKNDREARY